MSTLLWILFFGLLMSCIALVGGVTLIIREEFWQEATLPLIAFAAGSLIGGATFHMIPSAVESMGNVTSLYLWLDFGFLLFFAIEEFLHWHHSHTHVHPQCNSQPHTHQHPNKPMHFLHHHEGSCMQSSSFDGDPISNSKGTSTASLDVEMHNPSISSNCITDMETTPAPETQLEVQQHVEPVSPLSWLILLADGLHNLLGGMFVGAAFVDSIELGLSAWVAAAAHEIPQEIGDFVILVHGGWSKKKALLFNFISALIFPVGGLIAYAASKSIDVAFLIPFAAGNFLYIGASDLIPEIKHHHGTKESVIIFTSFTVGIAVMLGIRVAIEGW